MVFEIGERKRWLTKLRMLSIVRPDIAWNFISKWKFCAAASVAVILVGLATFFYRGGDNFDIDFSGGTMLTFELTGEQETNEVRNVLAQEFEGETITLERLSREGLTTTSPTKGSLFRVRTKESDVKKVESRVAKAMQAADYHLLSIDMTQSDIQPITAEGGGPKSQPARPGTSGSLPRRPSGRVDLQQRIDPGTHPGQLHQRLGRHSQGENRQERREGGEKVCQSRKTVPAPLAAAQLARGRGREQSRRRRAV